MPHAPQEQFATLQTDLRALQDGTLTPHAFSEQARAHGELLSALPERYTQVLHNLLDRLESSALFAEESCSFSQKDLTDSLQMWVDKAGTQLAP